MRRPGLTSAILSTAELGGCSGSQSALNPFGPEAHELAGLFWLFTGILTAVWVLTMAALLWALVARRSENQRNQSSMVRSVGAAVAATVVVLIVLTGLSYATQSRLYRSQSGETLRVHVTGHQWWWEVRYDDPQPKNVFSTANEIHIPAGQPVEVTLTTADVIHSFWVPGLFGKMDLINGIENRISFSATKPGTLRGQCAEFCGLQHAHMSFIVVVEAPEAFERWRAAQLQSAQTARSARGEQIFMNKPCVSCHTVRGTLAGGRVGPDLTHVASRTSIAAGALPMTRGALAAWIVDPQNIKPGSNMPPVELKPSEIHPLLDYLEGLR